MSDFPPYTPPAPGTYYIGAPPGVDPATGIPYYTAAPPAPAPVAVPQPPDLSLGPRPYGPGGDPYTGGPSLMAPGNVYYGNGQGAGLWYRSPVWNWNQRGWAPTREMEDVGRWRGDLATGNPEAWDAYTASLYHQFLPFVGEQQFGLMRNRLAGYAPEAASQVESVEWNAPKSTATDRNLYGAQRWSALREGFEAGQALFGGTDDPDSAKFDPQENTAKFLEQVIAIGSRYANREEGQGLHRWQHEDRSKEYNSLRNAYGPSLDPRVLELGDFLFNPDTQFQQAPAKSFAGNFYNPNPSQQNGQQNGQWQAAWGNPNSNWE